MAIKDWIHVSLLAFVASLGAYVTGYGIGSVNGLQNFSGFLEYFDLGNSSSNSSCTESSSLMEDDRLILGAIISVMFLGGVFGNLFAGKPADYFGRKVTLLVSGVLIVLGACIQSAAVEGASWMLIVGRFIAGVGYGVFYMAGPLYIAEIAPKHIRGRLTSLIGPTLAVGLITGYGANLLLFNKPFGWRVSRLLECLFGCIYIVGMSFMPRTPRWLMLKGRETEARDILRKTTSRRGQESIEEAIENIRLTINLDNNRNFCEELKVIFKRKNLERFLIGLPLHFFSPFCGTAIYLYSEPLFCSLGLLPFVTALVIGALTFCGTTFTTVCIDKLGRKPLMVGGGFAMCVLTVAAATLVYAFNLEEEDNPIVGYIVVCLVCLFMLVYSSTWYVIPWVVTSEIFPLEGRAIVVAVCTTCNWIFAYLLTQTFSLILTSFRTHGSLYMFSVINIGAGLFYLFFIPETKGVSLEQMEKVFLKPWLERVGLASCFSVSDPPPSTAVNGVANGVANEVMATGEVLNELPEAKQRYGYMENDKDWDEHWKRYEAELEDDDAPDPGQETTV